MYAYGAHTLEQGGWQRLSCSHWRQGEAEQSRYNQMAKRDAEILPFGAGAAGQRAPGMVMRPNPNAPVDGLLRGGLDTGWLALGRLPPSLRTHLLPLFERWQQHGLAELTGETLALTLAGRFWNVNLQAGLFEYLQSNPMGGEAATLAAHPGGARHHSRV